MAGMRTLVLTAALLTALAGCAVAPHATGLPQAVRAAGMQVLAHRHEGFELAMALRASAPDLPLRVYVEGDGRAWLDRYTPSPDPTPVKAVALQLALADDYPNVAYLARPCQYLRERSPGCEVGYWTARRFSPEVIAAMEDALDRLLQVSQAHGLQLVGYSGGAAIAVALAARRSDIRWLATVAGNLDTEAVNRFHRVDPMPASVNPASLAPRLSSLPQVHFSAVGDRIIPAATARAFIEAGPMQCATQVEVRGATHGEGWTERWPGLLAASGIAHWEKFPIDFPCKTLTIGAPTEGLSSGIRAHDFRRDLP